MVGTHASHVYYKVQESEGAVRDLRQQLGKVMSRLVTIEEKVGTVDEMLDYRDHIQSIRDRQEAIMKNLRSVK